MITKSEMNYQLTPISPVLIYSSVHLMVLTLLLIVTFNTCSMFFSVCILTALR